MSVLFDFMYKPYGTEKAAFGDAWCGPHRYQHGVPSLVAKYDAGRGGDGQSVEVYGIALPARFYTIKVLGGVNSVGETLPPWELGTGSSEAELAASIALAVSTGMLNLNREVGDEL